MKNFLLIVVVLVLAQRAVAETCYAPTGWSGHDPCALCASPSGTGYCTTTGWTACFASQQACEAANGGGNGGNDGSSSCYALSSWESSASCIECASVSGAGECISAGYTHCYSSMSECQASNPNAKPNPTVAPTQPPATKPLQTTTTRTTQPPRTTTRATQPPTTKPPQTTTRATVATTTSRNGGNQPIDGSCWKSACPDPSHLSLKRPAYKGPNCYAAQSKYPQFGPNWTPSGKTTFEKVVPTVQDFYFFVQGPWPAPIVPGYDSCSAALIVYESFICAQEFLEVLGKNFDATPNGLASKPSDFLNHAESEINRLELAAFIAHNWKETGVYNTFEENTPTAYAQADATYPPVDGVTYHGRGVMQISWNYNYGPFSEYMFGNKNALLYQPDMVDPYGPMGIMSAIWFWMNPHDFSGNYNGGAGGHVAPHDAIAHWTDGGLSQLYSTNKYDSVVGFGLTTNIINGGIECTGDTSGHRSRVGYFLTIYERISGINPLRSDASSCQANKICKGLFSGCGSSFSLASFTQKAGSCGTHTYV